MYYREIILRTLVKQDLRYALSRLHLLVCCTSITYNLNVQDALFFRTNFEGLVTQGSVQTKRSVKYTARGVLVA